MANQAENDVVKDSGESHISRPCSTQLKRADKTAKNRPSNTNCDATIPIVHNRGFLPWALSNTRFDINQHSRTL